MWDEIDERGKYVPGIRWLCLNDRYYLLIKMLRCYYAWHPWVYARCREVEAAPDGYIDIWAREHFKSTVITFAGSIQEILKDPEVTIGIFSHTKPIAKAFLAQIKREFESNLNLIHTFPDILWKDPQSQAPTWSLDAGITVRRAGNPKEATVEAHGLVDGQPTSKHFGILNYDDVVTRESVGTPEQIQKTTEAWELSDNLGTIGGRRRIIGTRYHYADTYAEIIKRGAARARIYPATDDGTVHGVPVLFTPSEWARRVRDQGEATVACQLLANPLAGKQRVFDITDLQQYEARPEALMCYLMVDPARSKKKDSANTAMVVLGIDEQSRKYLLDGYDHKMDLMERWLHMRDLWKKWRVAPGVQGIRVGYERYGADADLDYFEERKRTEGLPLDIEILEWPADGPGSKDDRIQRLLPDVRSHAFYLPFPTDDESITPMQVRLIAGGYEYRIATKIVQQDENGASYDLAERLKMQMSMYPFIERKDLIDATSRIYDLEPSPPAHQDSVVLEPEYA